MLAIEICNALLSGAGFKCGPAPIAAGEDLTDGYVTFQDISTVPQNDVTGWTGIDYVRMQVNVYHHEKLKASQRANQIKKLFSKQNPYCECTPAGERGSHDTETLLHCQQIDFYMTQSDNSC